MSKQRSSTPTWGGMHLICGINDENNSSSSLFGKSKYPSNSKTGIQTIQKWLHKMELFCETLPEFVLNEESGHCTLIFKKILNFHPTHLQTEYNLQPSECNAIYRLLYVFSIGFFDNMSKCIKSSHFNVSHNKLLNYLCKSYLNIIENILPKHHEIEMNAIGAAIMCQLKTFQCAHQELMNKLKMEKHSKMIHFKQERKKLEVVSLQIESAKYKIEKLEQRECKQENTLSGYHSVINTQCVQMEALRNRMNDYKQQSAELKEREGKLCVLLPIDEQNERVLWNVMAKNKQRIKEIENEKQEWIQRLHGIKTKYDKMEQMEQKKDRELMDQKLLNDDTFKEKDSLLEQLSELNVLRVCEEENMAKMHLNIVEIEENIKKKEMEFSEMQMESLKVAKESKEIKAEIKMHQKQFCMVRDEIETMNQKIKKVVENMEHSERKKDIRLIGLNAMNDKKRGRLDAMNKIMNDHAELNQEYEILQKQKSEKNDAFELLREKLRKNEHEITEMNAEKKRMNLEVLNCQTKRQEMLFSLDRKNEALKQQELRYESQRKACLQQIEYQQQRLITFEARHTKLQSEFKDKQKKNEDKLESIINAEDELKNTDIKCDALQKGIDVLLQQIDKRKQKLWKLSTEHDMKCQELERMKVDNTKRTDSVDHIFENIDTIKTKYELQLNELSQQISEFESKLKQRNALFLHHRSNTKILQHDHQSKLRRLQDNFEFRVQKLAEEIKNEGEKKRKFKLKMDEYNLRCDELKKELKIVKKRSDENEKVLMMKSKQNKELKADLSVNVSTHSIQMKKVKIANLEKEIKLAIIKLQTIKKRKEIIKNSNADKAIQVKKQRKVSFIAESSENISKSEASAKPTVSMSDTPKNEEFDDSTPTNLLIKHKKKYKKQKKKKKKIKKKVTIIKAPKLPIIKVQHHINTEKLKKVNWEKMLLNFENTINHYDVDKSEESSLKLNMSDDDTSSSKHIYLPTMAKLIVATHNKTPKKK